MFTALVATFAIFQATETPRDIKLPVMPISQFGTWLSKETGRNVTVLPEVADRLVYVNLKKRTLSELLQYLDNAVGVGTLDRNGVITLTNSRQKVSEDRAYKFLNENLGKLSQSEYNEAKLEDAIKKVLEISKKLGENGGDDTGKSWQEMEKLGRYDPGQQVLGEFAKALGSQAIRQLPLNERVVWSTSPTRLQRPWPGRAVTQIQQLNERLIAKNKLLEKLMPNDDENGYAFYNQISYAYGGVENPVAAMQGIIQRSEDAVVIHVYFYDAEGNHVNLVQQHVSGFYSEQRMEDYEKFSKAYDSVKGEFALTEKDHYELERISKLSFGYGRSMKFDKSDLEWAATVDQVEPMSGVCSRIFDFACEMTGNETVREIIYPIYTDSKQKSIEASQAAMMLFLSFDVLPDEAPINKLIVDPLEGMGSMMRYLPPRRATATAARKVLADGRLTLDAVADGVKFLSSSEQLPAFVTGIVKLSGQSAGEFYIEPHGWEAFILQAYAQLNAQQRRAVWTEQGFSFDANRAPQGIKRLFDETIVKTEVQLGSMGERFYGGGYYMSTAQDEEEEWPESVANSSWNREQTVFMALQQAQPINIKLSAGNAKTFLVETSYDEWSQVSTMGLEQVASMIVFSEAAAKQGAPGYQKMGGIAPCEESSITLTLQFGQFPAHRSIFKFLADRPGAMGDISKLPEEDQKKVNALIEKYRKDYGDIQFGGSPNRVIKPN